MKIEIQPMDWSINETPSLDCFAIVGDLILEADSQITVEKMKGIIIDFVKSVDGDESKIEWQVNETS